MGNGKGTIATNTRTYLRYVDPDISGVIWMLLYSVAIYILIEGLLYLLRTVLAIGFGVADVIFSMAIKMLDLAPVQMPSWASRLSWLAYGKGIWTSPRWFSACWNMQVLRAVMEMTAVWHQGLRDSLHDVPFQTFKRARSQRGNFLFVSSVGARHAERGS